MLGRADDTIVTGGENVSPAEVEQALLEHPAVADAAVHGREDPEWQEAVVATVVLADGSQVSEDELREFCRERLAPHKVPKAIAFTRELPRNAQGKLQRDSELRIASPRYPPCLTSSTRATPTSGCSRARPWPCSATAPRVTPTR